MGKPLDMRGEQMSNNEVCVICNEGISNPICPDCLMREIEQWLHEKQPSLVQNLQGLFTVFEDVEQNMSCVVCRSSMHICPHCVAREVHSMLYEINQEVAEEFFNYFNFQLECISHFWVSR